MQHSPPALFHRFLQWFCKPELLTAIEGDLIELYQERLNVKGRWKANVLFAVDVLLLLRPGIVKPLFQSEQSVGASIVVNYFKTATRVMVKSKMHTAITVLGLAIGILSSLVIALFTFSELEVNQQFKNVDRLFIVRSDFKPGYQSFEWFVPAPLASRAVELYPSTFASCYRMLDRNVNLSSGDKHVRVQSVIGDSTLFSMFGFDVLYGNPESALVAPGGIVITEKLAQQLFGKTDVRGELVTLATERNGPREMVVNAVIRNPQQKNAVTDFMNMDAQVFLNFHVAQDYFQDFDIHNWETEAITYLQLHAGANALHASRLLNDLVKDEAPPFISEARLMELHTLKNFYLTTNNSAIQKLLITLGAAALFILILSITNFINITVAGSMARLKEMGVRKVVGGGRRDIVYQLLCESILVTMLAAAFALLTYQLVLPYISTVFNATFIGLCEWSLRTWAIFFLALLGVGIVAGILPAIRLAKTRPVETMKGSISAGRTSAFSRVILVTQFSVTTFVLIVAVVLTQQLKYFLSTDVGFDKSGVLVIDSVPRVFSEEGYQKVETAKEQLSKVAGVEAITLSWGAPQYNFNAFDTRVQVLGRAESQSAMLSVGSADDTYVDVFGIKLADGRFLKTSTQRTNELVLNEKAGKILQLSVGDRVTIQGFRDSVFSVVGILKDFHVESMHQPIKPLCIMSNHDFGAYRFLSLKVQHDDLSLMLTQLERQWRSIYNHEPFQFQFAEDRFKYLYQTELQMKKSASLAAVLMLLIVLTGVVGLVSYTAARRSKEIGIRKVMGASSTQILGLISKEYVQMILVAFLVAPAAAFYFTEQWLAQFAYRMEISWWMFLVPMASLLLLTIATASAKALGTARLNPVNSIRLQ